MALDTYADADVPRRWPFCERKVIRQSPHTGKIAGFVCHDISRGLCVYTTLRGRRHLYEKGEGYAVSDSILANLPGSCSRILIHDGKDPEPFGVWEFTVRQYEDGPSVPEGDLDDPADTQRYVPLDDHIDQWEFERERRLFRHPFHEAVDRIGWRGYSKAVRERAERRQRRTNPYRTRGAAHVDATPGGSGRQKTFRRWEER